MVLSVNKSVLQLNKETQDLGLKWSVSKDFDKIGAFIGVA